MRLALSMLLCLVVVFAFTAGVMAEEKTVTLEGKITCGKCDLKKDKACATVIVAKDKDGKEVVYYFDEKGHKDNHKTICTEPKDGKVVGVVSEKGGKKIVTVSKVEFAK